MTAPSAIPDMSKIRSACEKQPVLPLIVQPTATWASLPAPPILWLLAELLAMREVGGFVGRSNVGKGFVVLLWLLSVATGRDVFGRKGTGRPMKAILIEMEDSPEELHRRISRLLDYMRMDPTWTKEDEVVFWQNLVILTPNWTDQSAKTLTALCPTIVATVSNLTKDGSEVGLIVLDTLAALSAGDENSVEGQRDFIAALYELRDKTKACVLVVHHIRKGPNGGKAPGMADRLSYDTVRGSSANVAAWRFVIQIEALTPAEASRLGLDEEKALRGGYAVLATTKVVSGPKGEWLLLEQADGIGGGFWGLHPNSDHLCVQLRSKAAVAQLTQDEAVLLSIADGITERADLKAKHWPRAEAPVAEMALKGVLQRLRGSRHRWVEQGRSMALTPEGLQRVKQLRGGNQSSLKVVPNLEELLEMA